MCVGKTKELMMPGNYMEMTEKEMEYDGAFAWSIAGAVLSVGLSIASNCLANAGYKEAAIACSCASMVVGVVSGGYAIASCFNAVTRTAAIVAGGSAAWGLCVGPIYKSINLGIRLR